MALSTKHRSALYDHLAQHVGAEVTEAFLAEFPARDGDERVTKDHLQAGLSELRVEMAQLRTEMHELSAATNRRLTTVALGITAVMLTAYGAVTSALIVALG